MTQVAVAVIHAGRSNRVSRQAPAALGAAVRRKGVIDNTQTQSNSDFGSRACLNDSSRTTGRPGTNRIELLSDGLHNPTDDHSVMYVSDPWNDNRERHRAATPSTAGRPRPEPVTQAGCRGSGRGRTRRQRTNVRKSSIIAAKGPLGTAPIGGVTSPRARSRPSPTGAPLSTTHRPGRCFALLGCSRCGRSRRLRARPQSPSDANQRWYRHR